MAILIPSKNIYEKQNPKVRDNVIERIEIGAVEITPNNEYETPVYNEILDLNTFIEQENNEKQRYIVDTGTDGESMYYNYAYVYLNNKIKYINKKITINKLKNNNLISKIYYGKNKDDEEEIEYSLRLKKEKKPIYAKIQMTGYQATILEKSYGEITESTEIIQTSNERQFPIMPILISKTVFGATASLNGVNDPTNLLISYKKNEENYEIEIQILEYFYAENFKGGYDIVGPLNRPTVEINVEGEVEEYTPLSLEITLYGNTIGIDLTDKTVYINGEAQKKVHSVEGNELMQTSNYLLDSGAKAIETMYGATQKEYALGKETATIRCSIGDYYDYKSGEKVISADFIGKDTFHDEYQEVEYIESTGTQYIDTGIKTSNSLSFEIRTNYANGTLLGAQDSSNAEKCIAIAGSSNSEYVRFLSGSAGQFLGIPVNTYGFYDLTIKAGKATLTYNNKPTDISLTTKNNKIDLPIYIFARNVDGVASGYSPRKLFYFKVYDNGNLVRDFIPVYRKSDGAIGLYDLVEKSFYANAGTGTFLKGADTEVEVEPTGKALKMSFEIGDEVIPMVYGADGKDYPMSTYKNGSPKVFVVRGSKIFYDGAIFQEIFLQERLTN